MPYAQPKTCLLALAITLSIACHPQGARAEVMPGEQSATRFFDLPAAPLVRHGFGAESGTACCRDEQTFRATWE